MVRYAFTVRDFQLYSLPVSRRTLGSFGKCDDATQPSANNQVAAQYVMHQPGDGHTLFVGPESAFIVNPTLYPDLRYKLTDFMPSP